MAVDAENFHRVIHQLPKRRGVLRVYHERFAHTAEGAVGEEEEFTLSVCDELSKHGGAVYIVRSPLRLGDSLVQQPSPLVLAAGYIVDELSAAYLRADADDAVYGLRDHGRECLRLCKRRQHLGFGVLAARGFVGALVELACQEAVVEAAVGQNLDGEIGVRLVADDPAFGVEGHASGEGDALRAAAGGEGHVPGVDLVLHAVAFKDVLLLEVRYLAAREGGAAVVFFGPLHVRRRPRLDHAAVLFVVLGLYVRQGAVTVEYQPVERAVREHAFPRPGAALVPHVYGVLLQPGTELNALHLGAVFVCEIGRQAVPGVQTVRVERGLVFRRGV